MSIWLLNTKCMAEHSAAASLHPHGSANQAFRHTFFASNAKNNLSKFFLIQQTTAENCTDELTGTLMSGTQYLLGRLGPEPQNQCTTKRDRSNIQSAGALFFVLPASAFSPITSPMTNPGRGGATDEYPQAMRRMKLYIEESSPLGSLSGIRKAGGAGSRSREER